ncbi:MAG: putative Lysine N-methyltransferase N6AMT2 [Streblomastix strix]|uniref:Putative Lysine N-methyltransferase N6AMT2 n=1 Tax=Streblomastix strix TaxID=222440 RepID=A0A5J4TZD8_9EUKA|nr:MAG: putative Lysine N-methyltransferase N6AMT2 [Streblomastix strix]
MQDKDYLTELSAETLAILNQFLVEQQSKIENPEDEDWRLAQFWYTEETRQTLCNEAINMSGPNNRIAVVSAPSLFVKLKQMNKIDHAVLFEYDQRFKTEYGDNFCFYDCADPEQIPNQYKGSFDFVIGDPPRLNQETSSSFLRTLRLLQRNEQTPLVLITGSVMKDYLENHEHLHTCSFEPLNNRLMNPMLCYTNYHSKGLGCVCDECQKQVNVRQEQAVSGLDDQNQDESSKSGEY